MTIARDLTIDATSTIVNIDPGRPREGIRPRYSGLREEGTANTPSSTISLTILRQISNGGDERTRTAGPLVANEVLSQTELHPHRIPVLSKKWRREGDSNPRSACALNGFRDRPIQPLWHLSAGILANLLRKGKPANSCVSH